MLAAEPGDHGATPEADAGVVIDHFPFVFEHGLRVSEDPVENLMAFFAGPPGRAVVEIGLGGAEPREAALRPGVVEMDHGADDGQEAGDRWQRQLRVEGRVDGAFEVAHGVLDGPVVRGSVDGAVERNDGVLGEPIVEDFRIERRAVVPLEQEGRAMAGAEASEPFAVFWGRFRCDDQGLENEVGGKIPGEHDHDARPCRGGLEVEGIDGPSKVGSMPGNLEFGPAQAAQMNAAQAGDERAHSTARDPMLKAADD